MNLFSHITTEKEGNFSFC